MLAGRRSHLCDRLSRLFGFWRDETGAAATPGLEGLAGKRIYWGTSVADKGYPVPHLQCQQRLFRSEKRC